MVPPLWELCRSRGDYRAAWDRLGLEAVAPPEPAADKLAHCQHRSPRPLRDERGKVRLVAY